MVSDRSQNYSIFNRIFKHNLEHKDMNQAGIMQNEEFRQVMESGQQARVRNGPVKSCFHHDPWVMLIRPVWVTFTLNRVTPEMS